MSSICTSSSVQYLYPQILLMCLLILCVFAVFVLPSCSATTDLLPFGSSASCSLTRRPWRLSSQRSDPFRRSSAAHLCSVRGHNQSFKLLHRSTTAHTNTQAHNITFGSIRFFHAGISANLFSSHALRHTADLSGCGTL